MSASGRIVAAASKVVNVASVPQRSPFRYPGGKTWLVPYFRNWCASLPRKPRRLIEPFAGGGIIGLSVAAEHLADEVILGELDHAVASVWHTILSDDCEWLIERILSFRMERTSVIRELGQQPRNRRELAFQTLLRNRVQRGGIMAPGASLMKNGENGRGLQSRWYPNTLAKRIRNIHNMRDRITFLESDAFELCHRFLKHKTAAFFVDPPYTVAGKRAGKRLYTHNEIDHALLFATLAKALGAVMLTYDESKDVRELAALYHFNAEVVPMRNTHNTVMNELVITNAGSCFFYPDAFEITVSPSAPAGFK